MGKLGWSWHQDMLNGIRGECHATDIDMYFTIHPCRPDHKRWRCFFKLQGAFEELTNRKMARSKREAIRICENFHEVHVRTIALANGYIRLADNQRVCDEVVLRGAVALAESVLNEEIRKRIATHPDTTSQWELMARTLLDCIRKPNEQAQAEQKK